MVEHPNSMSTQPLHRPFVICVEVVHKYEKKNHLLSGPGQLPQEPVSCQLPERAEGQPPAGQLQPGRGRRRFRERRAARQPVQHPGWYLFIL